MGLKVSALFTNTLQLDRMSCMVGTDWWTGGIKFASLSRTYRVYILGSLWPRSRQRSPLRILSDAPKFRAECLQTLRDGEVEEESAAPPSIYATIAAIFAHDFITFLTGHFGTNPNGKGRTFSPHFLLIFALSARSPFPARRAVSQRPLGLWSARRGVGRSQSS